MAATVIINEWNGTGGTKTAKTSGTIRFKNADNATVDLNNPLVVPSSGMDYSFEKWVRLEITGGTFTQVSNLRAYTDGANGFGTGVKLWFATTGTYDSTNGPQEPSTSNDPPLGPDGVTPMSDIFTKTSGAPIDMDAVNTGPFTTTGNIGDFLVMVMEVESTAAQGTLTSEQLTFAYDEI